MKTIKEYLLNEATSVLNMQPRNNRELKELVGKLNGIILFSLVNNKVKIK